MLLTVTATALFTILYSENVQQRITAMTGLTGLAFFANFAIYHFSNNYFGPSSVGNPLLHLWSLGVEDQFYLVFPAVFLAAYKKLKLKHLLGFLAIITLLSMSFDLISLKYNQGWINVLSSFYSPVARIWQFGLGIGFALLKTKNIQQKKVKILQDIGFLMIVTSCFIIPNGSIKIQSLSVIPTLLTAIFMYLGSQHENISFTTKTLSHFGDISYELYLWHYPLIVFFPLIFSSMTKSEIDILIIIMAYCLANLTAKKVTNPIRSGRLKIGAKKISYYLALPILLLSLVVVGSDINWFRDSGVSSRLELSENYLGARLGCFQNYPFDENYSWDSSKCTTHPELRKQIFLTGDSNADQFSDVISKIANNLNYSFATRTRSSCPFTTLKLPGFRDTGYCQRFVKDVIAYLRSSKKGDVIIANTDWYWQDPSISVDGPQGELTNNAVLKFNLYVANLKTLVKTIETFGDHVYLIEPIPNFLFQSQTLQNSLFLGPECSVLSTLLHNSCRDAGLSISQIADSQSYFWSGTKNAALSSGAIPIDVAPQICKNDFCSSYQKNHWIYRDLNHITVHESLLLQDYMSQYFRN